MNIKLIIFTLTLGFLSLAGAAQKNLCDELIESGSSTPDQIKKCHEKMGVSEYFQAQEEGRRLQETTKISQATVDSKKNDNLETKKFTLEELIEAGFGKPFYAVTDDYRNRRYKRERVTEGNSLCSFLGYEKALKSVVSVEINQEDSNLKGLVIDTGLFGGVKPPALYRQDDPKVGVRKYLEITCIKRKDKNADTTNDALKSVIEDLVVLDEVINPVPQDKSSQVFDKNRTKKTETTPHGFKTPDWMKSEPGQAIQK